LLLNNLVRQTCVALLGASFVFGPAIADDASSSFGKWSVRTGEDPMTDQKIVTMSVTADGKDAVEPNAVTLILQCSKENGAIGISWKHQFLGGEELSYGRYKDVTFRADKSSPFSEAWRVLEDGTTMRADMPEQFVKKIRGSARLVVQVTPFQEQVATVVFETAGLLDALSNSRPECDWFIRDVLWEQYQQKLKAEAKPSK
jgi:type VI secretion system protein VasI